MQNGNTRDRARRATLLLTLSRTVTTHTRHELHVCVNIHSISIRACAVAFVIASVRVLPSFSSSPWWETQSRRAENC